MITVIQKDSFLFYRNTYLLQNLTLWRGNVTALMRRSEHASDNTLQLETSDLETLLRTMIANTLKINPTNAKNAAKNPRIIRPDMQFKIHGKINFTCQENVFFNFLSNFTCSHSVFFVFHKRCARATSFLAHLKTFLLISIP